MVWPQCGHTGTEFRVASASVDLALQGTQHQRAIFDFHLSLQRQEAGRMIG